MEVSPQTPYIGHITIALDYIEEHLNQTGKPLSIYDPTTNRRLSVQACKAYIKLLKKEGRVAIAIDCPSPKSDGTCPRHPIPKESIVNVLTRKGGDKQA